MVFVNLLPPLGIRLYTAIIMCFIIWLAPRAGKMNQIASQPLKKFTSTVLQGEVSFVFFLERWSFPFFYKQIFV